jgi:hypothetical protein
MPPKKAAKKAAKKAPGQHDPHNAGKDARRTFEHLGRVQALSSLISDESDSLNFLMKTADAAYQAHSTRNARISCALQNSSALRLSTSMQQKPYLPS